MNTLRKSANRGFTIVELIIVIGIIGILSTLSFVGYSSVLKSARDTKRKAELSQLRVALELYKSSQDTPSYPPGAGIASSILKDSLAKFADSIPTDPYTSKNINYHYKALKTARDGEGADCTEDDEFCDDFILGANLESVPDTSKCSPEISCGTNIPCNYCLGPKGKR